MPAPGVVAVSVGDHRPVHRPPGSMYNIGLRAMDALVGESSSDMGWLRRRYPCGEQARQVRSSGRRPIFGAWATRRSAPARQCGEKLMGRTDKRFCSDACRNLYHY